MVAAIILSRQVFLLSILTFFAALLQDNSLVVTGFHNYGRSMKTTPSRRRTSSRSRDPLFVVRAASKTVADFTASVTASDTTVGSSLSGTGFSVPSLIPTKEIEQAFSSLSDQAERILQQINEVFVGPFLIPTKYIEHAFSDLLDQVERFLQQINDVFVAVLLSFPENGAASSASAISSSIESMLTQIKEELTSMAGYLPYGQQEEDVLTKVVDFMNGAYSTFSTPEAITVSAVISFMTITSILTWGDVPPPAVPYPKNKYDPYAASDFFDRRPIMVVSRALQIAIKSLKFALGLAQDKFIGGEKTWEQNQEQRGLELVKLLAELGPTFIKIGQSLSIRTDLLPPTYIRALSSLQDSVPAFDTATAKSTLEDAWGVPVEQVLNGGLSEEPVAAASLGQVYKARLKDSGVEVAIKVQRPQITTQIALDMHLLREFAYPFKRVFNVNTDTVGTVDAWGSGFVDELDYLQEASNGKYFSEQILKTTLKNVVLAPKVIDEYTSGKVLVTEWVDGERLDKSSQEDVTILCSICMNTYLSMLLEMGILHCDPHPGNLLRTPDGRLCILDWGMVTSIPPQLQLTLIEHMAHLTSGDYEEVPRDLYLLGFVPADKEGVIEDSGVVEVLANIYGQWTTGGGLKSINANDVLNQMQDLAATRGNLFQIPPYFAYIAKSFSVLEGIGLSNDPQYSIINECLPYVSNRLLTDQETMGNALNTFIFGPDKHNLETRLVDTNRIEQLLTGYGNYTATSASGVLSTPTAASGAGELVTLSGNTTTSSSIEMLEKQADEIFDIIFTEEETPLQQILIEQLSKILAANTRSLWTEARVRSGILPTGRTLLGTLVDPLGLFQTSPLVNACDEDERAVQITQELITLFRSQTQQSMPGVGVHYGTQSAQLSNEELIIFSRILSRKLWDRRTALFKSSTRFTNQMLQLTVSRLDSTERVPIKGQRTTPTVGVAAASSPSAMAAAKTTAYDDSDSKTTTTSPRLQKARDRLNSLST